MFDLDLALRFGAALGLGLLLGLERERVVIVGMVNRSLAGGLALALGLMMAAGLLVSLVLWRRTRFHGRGVVTAGTNPFELGEAIKFGLLFGVVTVVAKAAEVYLGETRAPSPV
jgi:uncharacterized membrane protein (DUF4010 family)